MKKEFSKNTTVLCSFNWKDNKHRTKPSQNPNTLQQIINDILMIQKNIEKVKF